MLFNNDTFYDVKNRSVEIYLTSSPGIVILGTFLYLLFTLVLIKD